MKKLVIAVLTASAVITGAAVVSAECIYFPNESCQKNEFCIEECIGNCRQYNCYGTQHRMRRTGHHRRYCVGNNEYCQYR